MNITEVLKSLSNSDGVSGEETEAAEKALEYLKEYTDICHIKNGNVIGEFGTRTEKKPHILLDAHIDQIGFIVTYITDDGFLKVGKCGGIDRRLTAAQKVTVHGNKKIMGTVSSIPPHLINSEKKVPEIEDLFIDIGMSKKEAEKFVSLGDKITFNADFMQLTGTKVTGKALDDRAGVTAVLYALSLLKDDISNLKCSFSVLFSTQEELGERGAKIGGFEIMPDYAIAVDVGFGFTDGEDKTKCGILGKGGMIGISPCLDKDLSDRLTKIAVTNNIPCQYEVMSGLTSTNADQFSVTGKGAKTVTLSIPLKYMHTPVEIIDTDDIKYTGELLAEYIRSVDNA